MTTTQLRGGAGRRTRLAVAVAVLLAAAMPSAAAGWTEEAVTQGWFLSRPSVAVEADDDVVIVYQRTGTDPGLFLATDAGGGWASSRVTSADDWLPDVALTAGDKVHVAYVRVGTDAGIHHVTNATGSWVDTRLTTESAASGPSIAVDPDGHVHVVYPEWGFAPGLYHLTNATGSWVRTRLPSTVNDVRPSLAVDQLGHLHVAFARLAPEARGIHYLTDAGGTWVTKRLSTGADEAPELVLDDAGKVHVAYTRYSGAQPSLRYATDATGTWADTQLASAPYPEAWYGSPALAFDPSGVLHAAAELDDHPYYGNDSAQLHRFRLEGGQWSDEGTLANVPSDEGFAALAYTSEGSMRLAFERRWPDAGIRVYDPVGGVATVADSSLDTDPSIDRGPDDLARVAFHRRDQQGRLLMGTDSGVFSFEQAAQNVTWSGPDRTDIAVHTDGTARIVSGSVIATDETGPWHVGDLGATARPVAAVVVGANGVAHVAVGGDDLLAYGRLLDAGYMSWACGENVTCSGPETVNAFVDRPMDVDVALSPSGTAFVAGVVGDTIYIHRRGSPEWPVVRAADGAGDQRWPSLAIDAAGKVHLAYMQTTRGDGPNALPGIYYLTNTSGSWVTRRISRSTVDGPPSLIVTSTGRVAIAWSRAGSALEPGVWLATNRTGSWVTARVLAGYGIDQPVVSMKAGGKLEVAYTDGDGGVRILDESAQAAAAAASATAPARPSARPPAGPRDGGDAGSASPAIVRALQH